MDTPAQSGATSETVVNGGSLDDSTIALTSMDDSEYAQKRAAFLTRTQTLLSKFSAAGGGSIFVAAEVHKQAGERAIQMPILHTETIVSEPKTSVLVPEVII